MSRHLGWSLVPAVLLVIPACSGGSDPGSADSIDAGGDAFGAADAATSPDAAGSSRPDGGTMDGGDAGVACPALPAAGDAGPGPAHVVYPDPVFQSLGAPAVRARTVCVETSALATHATLDALVPGVVAEAGLTLASGTSCTCDWALSFVSSAPALTGSAASALKAAGTSDERYVVVNELAGGRPNATLFAASERAALYALRAALGFSAGSASGGRGVATGTVVDYPGIAWRGVVEGIYGNRVQEFGTQYTPGERSRLMRMMSRVRHNTYIYGPKFDPYSGSSWSVDYPTAVHDGAGNGQAIQVAAAEASANLMRFVWAIRPFGSFNWGSYASELAALETKLDHVRAQQGVMHFALFFDDLSVSASIAQQAQVMNDVNAHLQHIDPSDHLLVVWGDYAGSADGSTDALGPLVDPSVEIMWTGPCVESCTLNAGDIDPVDTSFKRKVSIWDNFPTATGCCNGAWAAPRMTGRDATLAGAITALYTNPVVNECHPECNSAVHIQDFFAQLGPVADYGWQPGKYDDTASYALWSPIVSSLEATVGACASAHCSSSGPVYPGWTCDPSDAGLYYCDPYNGDCVTDFVCPHGCSPQAAGTPDMCKP